MNNNKRTHEIQIDTEKGDIKSYSKVIKEIKKQFYQKTFLIAQHLISLIQANRFCVENCYKRFFLQMALPNMCILPFLFHPFILNIIYIKNLPCTT